MYLQKRIMWSFSAWLWVVSRILVLVVVVRTYECTCIQCANCIRHSIQFIGHARSHFRICLIQWSLTGLKRLMASIWNGPHVSAYNDSHSTCVGTRTHCMRSSQHVFAVWTVAVGAFPRKCKDQGRKFLQAVRYCAKNPWPCCTNWGCRIPRNSSNLVLPVWE